MPIGMSKNSINNNKIAAQYLLSAPEHAEQLEFSYFAGGSTI